MPLSVQVCSNFVGDGDVGNRSAMTAPGGVLSVPVEMGTFELRRALYFNKQSRETGQIYAANIAGQASVDKTSADNR